ncbi:MAG TPA: pyruvate formate lyase family protein [Syntrophorhabdaceae bacterium]|nr:pyruvate formate lyase family protein [Syntrophorhabdaceae bacterium]HPA07242.1 pyruvate formate lyase family protein [Methanoregulaceae archaeon]
MQSAPGYAAGVGRIARLKAAVQEYPRGICTERALLWTAYFKARKNRRKPMPVQVAEAVRHVLLNKSVIIYPDELIVGNYTSLRVGGIIYPELHGVPVMLDLPKFPWRKVNPLRISLTEQLKLALILPFWLPRFIVPKAFPNPLNQLRYSWEQLRARDYYIYEAGGIAHLVPDHARLIALGTDAIKTEIEALRQCNVDPEKDAFYQAALTSLEALALFGERYANLAQTLAAKEHDAQRRAELMEIASVCRRVPRHRAASFHEALQAIFFLHVAIFQESIGETICLGRLDQLLYPYYQHDLKSGRITPAQARELLAAFCIKLCETIPVHSQAIANLVGGMPSYQVITMGGTDRAGRDATNELTLMLLSITDELRMRQPNFHARLHKDSPQAFVQGIFAVLAGGSNSPALFNDEVIVPAMTAVGYELEDARDYVAIGCVEPTAPGKTLGSTDAAILNVPVSVELALNQGRRFGERLRSGAATPAVEDMHSMDDVAAAFLTQLEYLADKLIRDLQGIERALARFHPTPLTSAFIEGCLEKGVCSTQGGARYNFSGIQAVGVTTAGDALAAIERLVFEEERLTLTELREILCARPPDPYWFAALRSAPKFGNDDPQADSWTDFVVRHYARILRDKGLNTRGGAYLPGIYSNTAHVHFGKHTGALPCGRLAGEPFPSGMAPQNGMDKKGPTALINSMNRIDYRAIANGINFNLKLDAQALKGEKGRLVLDTLLGVYFKRGGMQAQLNVLDPSVLRDAKAHPDQYPYLLVRVSGFAAYFNELSPALQDEVIARTSNVAL